MFDLTNPTWEFIRPYCFDLDQSSSVNSESSITIRLFVAEGVTLGQDDASLAADEISQQNLYWNDDSCRHWFYDFKMTSGHWAGCLRIEENGSVWNVEIHD